jgi:D-glycero-D-manno-heptose 1,7-bisphosphate phosphatase
MNQKPTKAKRGASARPAVFFDRDGTLIVDQDYLSDPAGVRLIPGSAGAIRDLKKAGYRVYVVSNQSGVARGYFTEAAVKRVTARLKKMLAAQGAQLDGFFHCPHHPQGTVARYKKACRCRKPGPGMVEQAAEKHSLDLQHSYIVGDKLDDLLTARNAHLAGGLLVLTGYGCKSRRGLAAKDRLAVVKNALAAAKWILKHK